MVWNRENYQVETLECEGEQVTFRAYRNLVYVERPVDVSFQQMNLFIPCQYYEGGSINGYNGDTAPIFMPNMVGGYRPGILGEPGYKEVDGKEMPNTILRALQHGYVVASPAIRGRTKQNENGDFLGKAPACVVDYKAAVRYVRSLAQEIPGDTERIITNGTSAGGALSSLMGSTGNHPDYAPYLEALGAAQTSDAVFAASCYCPITNLEHADMAYEWEFGGETEYHRRKKHEENGRIFYTPVEGAMSELQIQTSEDLQAMFPAYLNSLELKNAQGELLTLDAKDNGSFKEHMKGIVMASAQRALEQGVNLFDKAWLTIEEGKVTAMEWEAYVHDITRMKCAPAFDDLALKSAENDLFGTIQGEDRHFTEYGVEHSLEQGGMAEENIIKMLNPMHYIADKQALNAKYFRIRHGECDRDTSLAISAILTLKLEEAGCKVDYHAPWNVPHAGDYDLDELFQWIDEICEQEKK